MSRNSSDNPSYVLLTQMIDRSGLLTSLRSSVMFVWTIADHIGSPDTVALLICQYALPFGSYVLLIAHLLIMFSVIVMCVVIAIRILFRFV